MKLWKGALTALVVSAMVVVPAHAQERFGLELNGMVGDFAVQPMEVGGEIMLEGREFARILGATAAFDAQEQSLTIRLGDTTAVYRADNTVYYINGNRRFLRQAVLVSEEQGGTLLLPIRQAAVGLGASARVDGGLVVVSAPQNVVVLLPDIGVPAGANVISLDQAFNMAVRNNTSVGAISGNVATMEQLRRSAVADFDIALFAGLDTAAQHAMRVVRILDADIGSRAHHTQALETISRMMVVNTLSAMRGQQVDRLLVLENIRLQTENVHLTRLRNELGFASANELIQAENELEGSRETLRSLELSIANQRSALNNILGLPSNANTHVSGGPRLLELGQSVSHGVANIETHARAAARYAPTVRILQAQVGAAQENYERSVPTVSPNPEATATDRASLRNTLNEVVRQAQDAISDIEQGVREAYGQLLVLESQRVALELELQQARQAYNTAQTSLVAGLVTEYDVQVARMGILGVEASILRNALAYENLLFMFENPFLVG